MRRYLPRLMLLLAITWTAAIEIRAEPKPLTPNSIEEAIEVGVSGNPTPYLLRYWSRTGEVNPTIVGAIYTPFLRVALASKDAQREGRLLTPGEIPAALIEPTLYVAFRWYCTDHECGDPTWNPFVPADHKIGLPGDRMPPSKDLDLRLTTAPLWLTRDVSLLASFGGQLPYNDVVLIAAYPLSVLGTRHDFVMYRDRLNVAESQNPIRSFLIGRVLPEELARWR